MPRRRRASSSFDSFDDDFDEVASSQSSKNGNPPVQRNAANARERARMRVLSSAFGRLKTKLPNIPPDTKLSKLDTLRLATMYIKQLKVLVEGGTSTREVLQEATGIFGVQGIPQNMSWPFGFHNMQCNSNNNNNNERLLAPIQYSSTEWNHARNNSSYKYGRNITCNSNGNGSSSNCNNFVTQDSTKVMESHHWYTQDIDEQYMGETVSNSGAYFESQMEHRHRQNHEMSQMNHELYLTSPTITQSSIR